MCDKCGRCGEPVAFGQGFNNWCETNQSGKKKYANFKLCQVCQRKLFYFLDDKELSVLEDPAARGNGQLKIKLKI